MAPPLSERVWRVLACPRCGGALEREAEAASAPSRGARCPGCGERFAANPAGQLDLRLAGAKSCRLDIELPGTAAPPLDGGMSFARLAANPHPEVEVERIAGTCHLPRDLRSHFPRARGAGSLALDLGCGTQVHMEVCELAGFEYVGLDYGAPEAMLLGDAQALPFAAASFELILSIAVVEHVPFPPLLAREAFRVLAPGGVFLGAVAFLEPFHQRSFYHHTHLGLLNTLRSGGFTVERIAPAGGWPGLVAQSHMGLFPGAPRWLARGLALPLLGLHRLWWRAGRLVDRGASESARQLKNAGALLFIARKR